MNCIFCQDSGSEPLQDNTVCECKYKRHASCWIDYVHSNKDLKCPMCRKDLKTKSSPPKTRSSMTSPLISARTIPYTTPYTSRLEPVQEEGTRISYEEFNDTVNRATESYQNTVVEIRPATTQTPQKDPSQEKNINKFYKVVLCLCIVAVFILVIVWLL